MTRFAANAAMRQMRGAAGAGDDAGPWGFASALPNGAVAGVVHTDTISALLHQAAYQTAIGALMAG
jgi:hypothetical protein